MTQPKYTIFIYRYFFILEREREREGGTSGEREGGKREGERKRVIERTT